MSIRNEYKLFKEYLATTMFSHVYAVLHPIIKASFIIRIERDDDLWT